MYMIKASTFWTESVKISMLFSRGWGVHQVHWLCGPADPAAEGGDADAGELWGMGPQPVQLLSKAAALPDGPRVQNHATPAALQTRKHGETSGTCKSGGIDPKNLELL